MLCYKALKLKTSSKNINKRYYFVMFIVAHHKASVSVVKYAVIEKPSGNHMQGTVHFYLPFSNPQVLY